MRARSTDFSLCTWFGDNSPVAQTGRLEQDADVVLFPWSEEGLKDVGIRDMKLYCAKQRNGPMGWQIDIAFDCDRQWFFTEQKYLRDESDLQNNPAVTAVAD